MIRWITVLAALMVVAVSAEGAYSGLTAAPQHLCMYKAAPTATDPSPPPIEVVPGPDHVCPRPQPSIWAIPNPVSPGGNTTVGWTSVYAWECNWSGGGYSGSGVNGSKVIGPLSSSFRINIVCTGDTTGGDPGPGTSYADVTVSGSPPPPPPPPPPGGQCPWVVDEADFVSQSGIPSTLATNQTANVSVTLRNSGATTWRASTGYKLGFANPLDENIWRTSPSWPGRVLLNGGETIAPCQSKTFNFTIKAPATSGAYNFQWRMVREGVQWFGQSTPNVVINVGSTLPPPSNVMLRCAVNPGPVVPIGNKIQGWFQNQCTHVPARMSVDICLMRKQTLSSEPRAFACKHDVRGVGVMSLSVTTSRDCNYTTFPYTWFVRGWGTASFTDGTYVSPKVDGAKLTWPCN